MSDAAWTSSSSVKRCAEKAQEPTAAAIVDSVLLSSSGRALFESSVICYADMRPLEAYRRSKA